MNDFSKNVIKRSCEEGGVNPTLILVGQQSEQYKFRETVELATELFGKAGMCVFNEAEKSVYLDVRATSSGIGAALDELRLASIFSNTFEGVIGVDLTRFSQDVYADYFKDFLSTLAEEIASSATIIFVSDEVVAAVVRNVCGGVVYSNCKERRV